MSLLSLLLLPSRHNANRVSVAAFCDPLVASRSEYLCCFDFVGTCSNSKVKGRSSTGFVSGRVLGGEVSVPCTKLGWQRKVSLE